MMSARKSILLIALTISTVLISLICLTLYGYHTQPRCFSQLGDSFSTSKCQDEIITFCTHTPGYSVSGSESIKGADLKYTITCPFQGTATLSGILGFLATFILLILFCSIGSRHKALRACILALGIMIITLLSLSFGLMISNVIDGANYPLDTTGKITFSTGSFIANILLTFIGIILVGLVTFFGFQAKRKVEDSGSRQYQMNELTEMSGDVIVETEKAPETQKGYTIFDEE